MVALDFFADGKHLVIDAVVTIVDRNTVLDKVATTPGCAAKHAEDKKFLADRTSKQPTSAHHGGPHVLVSFAMEDGGRLGAHAHALLRTLATWALAKGRTPPAKISHLVQKWQQRLSTLLYLALSVMPFASSALPQLPGNNTSRSVLSKGLIYIHTPS